MPDLLDPINTPVIAESQNDIMIKDIMELKKAESLSPTHNPRRWKEQFHFKDDGTLWVNIDNTWVQVGGGVKIAKGTGTTASNTTTTISTPFKPKFIRIQCGFAWPSIEIRSSSDCSATESAGTSGIILCKVGATYPAIRNISKILSIVNVNDVEAAAAEISNWGEDSISLTWITSTITTGYHYEIIG
jgi:hypothetical protein